MTPVPPTQAAPLPSPQQGGQPLAGHCVLEKQPGPFSGFMGVLFSRARRFQSGLQPLIPEPPRVDNGLKATQFSFPSPALLIVLGPQLAELKRV